MTIEILIAILIVLNVVFIVIILWRTGSRREREIFDELARSRQGTDRSFQHLREEILNSSTRFSDFILKRMNEISGLQNHQFENIRKTVEDKLRQIQEDNNKKLEEIRVTVDEKLHSTLEKRLGEAFKQVGDRLEKVHLGLGEMQKLAAGVGDLKKVLTNIKTRGTLGEIQLENQLSQLLSRSQYETNVMTREGGNARVEFAIKLPGKDEAEKPVWLPVDSKFPLDQYEHLLDAFDQGGKDAVAQASKRLETAIKSFAKEIRDKYIDPPHTTDFALMYLPVEGLYAEVLRTPGMFEVLQREYRVVPVGPTTLAAILNSLQMGFRTLAIEKRSSEVWKLLGVVKNQFGKFGDLLEKTRKKLHEAGQSIDDASKKSRYIEGRLSKVQDLPESESPTPLDK